MSKLYNILCYIDAENNKNVILRTSLYTVCFNVIKCFTLNWASPPTILKSIQEQLCVDTLPNAGSKHRKWNPAKERVEFSHRLSTKCRENATLSTFAGIKFMMRNNILLFESHRLQQPIRDVLSYCKNTQDN